MGIYYVTREEWKLEKDVILTGQPLLDSPIKGVPIEPEVKEEDVKKKRKRKKKSDE